MEVNLCDVNHLASDVLLPPRKRLLAGLKKQNSDGISYPSTSNLPNEYDDRINKLFRSHLNENSLSEEEIVEASRSAAEAAVKVAKAARAAADEKVVIAEKAVAAAKSALDLVANVSDETLSNERFLKKNKLKKQVQVQMLYSSNDKNPRDKNCGTDKELARTLHRAINSSPRISKNPSPSELKGHKHKRLKSLAFSEIMPDSNPSTSNGSILEGEADGGSSNEKETFMVKVNGSTSTFNKTDTSKMENGEVEKNHLNEKCGAEDTNSLSRKRGRMKQKKLPLSICNFRDRANPKEEVKYRSSKMSEEDTEIATDTKKPLFSVGPSVNSVMPVERSSSLWKCQAAFKASTCVKQNKVVQS